MREFVYKIPVFTFSVYPLQAKFPLKNLTEPEKYIFSSSEVNPLLMSFHSVVY